MRLCHGVYAIILSSDRVIMLQCFRGLFYCSFFLLLHSLELSSSNKFLSQNLDCTSVNNYIQDIFVIFFICNWINENDFVIVSFSNLGDVAALLLTLCCGARSISCCSSSRFLLLFFTSSQDYFRSDQSVHHT